ncbi:50S ribosomal protein L11 methyltransferase [Maledivibacter halophilus]|uniref:Ribosomal protein L11 methyltransferase n=1 Tax=Maledivibacter halophilus TaxID=36842 RepID=A0A1T5LUX1_9FIRM|nr:50S ribosomal protein L11 methyltransferase [Maledivibacter halophilus]SKC79655.1 [LSU ribosomal protein L11P]-lysine N-methyltransferase [Maledivibacter halophilus]
MKWNEITIKTTSEYVEAVCNILYDVGVGGVVIEDPKDLIINMKEETSWDYFDIDSLDIDYEGAVVKGYLPESQDLPDKIELIKQNVHNLSMENENSEPNQVTIAEVYEEDWANSWKKYYKPKKIGNKIVVKPSWEDYMPKENEKIIELDPGMAFGTGTHETTTMCIRLLEKYIRQGNTVYDIGCGSGILSIAAAKLEAGKVVAVDIDETACKVSRSNVKMNSVQDIVEIKNGNLMDVVKGKADIIVANIIAEIIIILANDIRKFMKDDSIFIASGIILDKVDEVVLALKENGLGILHVEKLGEWAAIVSKKEVLHE